MRVTLPESKPVIFRYVHSFSCENIIFSPDMGEITYEPARWINNFRRTLLILLANLSLPMGESLEPPLLKYFGDGACAKNDFMFFSFRKYDLPN